jgi:hypothetical protein
MIKRLRKQERKVGGYLDEDPMKDFQVNGIMETSTSADDTEEIRSRK